MYQVTVITHSGARATWCACYASSVQAVLAAIDLYPEACSISATVSPNVRPAPEALQ